MPDIEIDNILARIYEHSLEGLKAQVKRIMQQGYSPEQILLQYQQKILYN